MAAPDRETRAPKARPDPGPMRLAIGMTGLAAATAIATSIVQSPFGAAAPAPAATPEPTAAPTPPPLVVKHVTRYVQLKPGQTAPPGATVVKKPDPSPRVVVVTIPAPAAAPRRVVVVTTRQSGAK